MNHFDAFVFDCDGTLASIEGIVWLAKLNNCEEEIESLTEHAMSSGGINKALYEKRLNTIRPTKQQCIDVGKAYIQHLTKDIQIVIQALQKLNKSIYIASAGILDSVVYLANYLNIPSKNVCAVPLYFKDSGDYESFDHQHLMTKSDGKATFIQSLKEKHQHICAIGDGANDLSMMTQADLFVGFGGNFYRESIKNACENYIDTKSMRPLLSLTLSSEEYTAIRSIEAN